MDSKRKALGEGVLRLIWFDIAKKVVEKAILVYELDEDQANALRKMFLKPNHYGVESL